MAANNIGYSAARQFESKSGQPLVIKLRMFGINRKEFSKSFLKSKELPKNSKPAPALKEAYNYAPHNNIARFIS